MGDSMARIPQLWEIMGFIEDAFQIRAPHGFGKSCAHLAFCPNGGSPNIVTCSCEPLYSGTARTADEHALKHNHAPSAGTALSRSICIISADAGDDRPLSTNLTHLVAKRHNEVASYWSLTHHLNRLYAVLHGYRFHRPEVHDEELDS